MKILRIISRIVVGLVFVFSGFVKVIDPLGSTYKFIDYFNSFGMEWMEPAAFPLAILMSAAEFIIGFALLFRLRMKIASWSVLLFMSFFTPLTLYLAIANPVSDCGCFGDAWVISNWATFFKNVVFMTFTIIIFVNRKKYDAVSTVKAEWQLVAVVSLIIVSLSVYCFKHLPIIDFRPYKVGNDISALAKEYDELDETIPAEKALLDKIPKGETHDIFNTILTYKKDRVEKEFSIDNLPDSTWTWVKTDNILVSEGYKPPVHDFSIASDTEGEITDIVLADKNYSFLFIAYDINKTNADAYVETYKLAEFCRDNNYPFYCITSSSTDAIDELVETVKKELNYTETEPIIISDTIFTTVYLYEKDGELQEFYEGDLPDDSWILVSEDMFEEVITTEQSTDNFAYKFYNGSDETNLKTIVRSNPGLVILKKGVVIDKWHYNDIPDIEEFKIDILK